MISVALHPIDTWFFRDGRPYNQHEPWQTDVASLFPPHPTTVSGALRAQLAREAGWDGHSRWPEEIARVLGQTVEDTGESRFFCGGLARNGEVFYPAPLSLLGNPEEGPDDHARFEPRTLLAPGPAFRSDLGVIRLPVAGDAGPELRGPGSFWISAQGLGELLAGRLPKAEELIPEAALYELEPRLGIVRDPERRTTDSQEGTALYSPKHVRLARNVALLAGWSGVPENWTPACGQPFPFGGEGRLAILVEPPAHAHQPAAPRESLTRHLTVVLITPALFPSAPKPGDDLHGLEGLRIVSGCLGAAQRIGGYDSLRRRSLPLQSYVPAGSVFFCEATEPALSRLRGEPDNPADLLVGKNTAHGWGRACLGLWNDAT